MNENITLKALKAGKYGTRRLVAGDVFDAKRRDARVLVAVGKAEEARGGKAAETPAEQAMTAAELLAKQGDMHFLSFKAAAAKILGPEMETKKADIIAALQLRAEC